MRKIKLARQRRKNKHQKTDDLPEKKDKHVKNEKEKKNKKTNLNKGKTEVYKDRFLVEHRKEKKELARFKRSTNNVGKRRLEEDNENDDVEIKQLEKKLKLNKRKSKGIAKAFVSDGLDYLLDICDEENRKIVVETEKNILGAESDSDSEGLKIKKTKPVTKKSKTQSNKLVDNDSDEILESEEEEIDEDEFDEEDEFDKDEFDDENFDEENIDEELEGDINEEDISDEEENSEKSDTEKNNPSSNKNKSSKQNENGIWEDIYGRKRDADGNVINEAAKYVPPAARLKQSADTSKSEKFLRLKRQFKGLINRLSESNMHSIASQIEELYMSNSRNDMNEILSTLITEALISTILQPEYLIMEHVMLVTILHANVGTEVGAHFLQFLVQKYNEMLKKCPDVENKELDSIILILSHLYNFKVIGSRLLYQILDQLAQKFTEKEIELILLILRSVGFSLRKDDPVALKELIVKLQEKAGSTESNNLRIKFMLETLLAIKNNNMNKIPQYDPVHIEHLKKIMKSFLRKGNTISPFEIGLNDLLQVNERGRWWIIGSAWTGKEDLKNESTEKEENLFLSKKLLDLARKQRMNTDSRRNIFCILMSAEDYMDAFEKLHRLGLKGQQSRDIVYVIMDCCLQEQKFNPYYAVLAQKFCDFDRKYQITIQYAFWDKLKELKSCTNQQIFNLAQFLSHLFVEKGLPLSVLKAIQLTELDKYEMKLLRRIMINILLHENIETCLEVFTRITASPKLHHFREGLRLFISHFLIKNMKEGVLSDKEKELLKQRATYVEKLLSTKGSRAMF